MSDIRLCRPDGERSTVGTALLADGLAERAAFGGIADAGAGAVRLEEIDLVRVDAKPGHRLFDEEALRLVRGQRDAVRVSVGIGAGPLDDGMDRIAVSKCIGQRFDDDDTAAFATHIAAWVLAEGPALAIGREHGRF